MLFFSTRAIPTVPFTATSGFGSAKNATCSRSMTPRLMCPPTAHLSEYVRQGFDLVGISGGEALLGPQCSGLLLGRKDLVQAPRNAISPHAGISRGMKVGKEEIIGSLAAVERYLKVDHDAEQREMEARVQ
jgi:seryl-tRNA(Sec) selenium transferase